MNDLASIATKFIENSHDGFIVADKTGTILFVNGSFSEITGYSVDEVLGKNPRILKSGKHDQEFYKNMWGSINTDGFWSGEIWNKRKNGEIYPQRVSINMVKDSQKAPGIYYVAIFHDITESKKSEDEFRHRAYHDRLTGLPNRHLFYDRLNQAIGRASRNKSTCAALFIDLDNFKYINDSFGHDVGDLLLKEIANRLKQCARDVDTVSRIGGDEFTIILDTLTDKEESAIVAKRVLASISKELGIHEQELYITVSIGIAIYPENGKDAAELVKNADTAMYHAKEKGKNAYFYFTDALNVKAKKRMELEINLRKAINERKLIAFYQPKLNINTGKIVGMEALSRWPMADGKFLSPAEYIPVAEQTGMVIDMDSLMFEKSCEFTKRLKEYIPSENGFKVSVNLSSLNFESKGLSASIFNIIKKYGLSPKDVELEVTETLIIRNIESTIQILNSLDSKGLKISIDDFGTGYSSLSYLTQFPFSTLKIDQSFVHNLATDANSRTIATAIISIAKGLNVEVIAEGVENKEQLDILLEMGCDQIQGYLFSRPLPEEEMVALMKENKTYFL
ncbi:MAG: EAL domain-containing protein [Nitrospinota bacterium]|nr:EAL domain-containing protein [Nitrospinota bacterium]